MKHFLWKLLAFTLIVLVGCDKSDESSSSKFEGEWAFVADYDNEDGWDYYDKSDAYIKISGNSIAIYEANDLDGYSFGNGYYECSRNDFEYVISTTFKLKGDKAYLDGVAEAGYIQLKDGRLYRYYTEDRYESCELYERIKGFTED